MFSVRKELNIYLVKWKRRLHRKPINQFAFEIHLKKSEKAWEQTSGVRRGGGGTKERWAKNVQLWTLRISLEGNRVKYLYECLLGPEIELCASSLCCANMSFHIL
jgi:hypothetical protein